MLCWSVPLKRGPQTDDFYGCAAGPVEDKVYSFGGSFYNGKTYNNKDQIDVHVFNTVTLRWMTLPPVTTGRGECSLDVPSMRCEHTAVLIEDIIYIWGGTVNCKITVDHDDWFDITGDKDNILYAFDVDAHRWFIPKVSGTVPEGREDHSACVLEKVMFIHGGWNQLTGGTNDIYKLDTTTMIWSLINTRGNSPPVSYHTSATIIGTKMFVFGGHLHQDNNIRVFDTETSYWLNTPSAQLVPEQRHGHAAFVYNGELYIHGGGDYELRQVFNDLWKLNPKTFSWRKVEPKGKGGLQVEPTGWLDTVCCCMVGDRIILFGSGLILQILHLNPSLKTLCKLAVLQNGLEQSGLPHNIRWELAAMTTET